MLAALGSAAILPVAAAAQATAESAGDIIVTAGKREERITEVPFAITAIGQREIQDRGSIDIKELQYSIPGLNIQELSPGANRTTLRGINPGAGTGLPIVSTYVDEVGVTIDQQQRDGIFPLVDLERIEVLRGPQGTLYGEGSMAGTIRYITRNPSLTDVDGFIEGNVYKQDKGDVGYRVNGAVGLPIIKDQIGLRISGGYDKLAGWIDYPLANVEDANETERWFIRPKLFAQLSDSLTFSLLYQYFSQESDTDAIADADNRGTRSQPELFPGSDKSHLVNAILQYDFGPATLTASTGYQQRDLLFNGAVSGLRIEFDTRFKQLTNEIRLSSNGEGTFQYVFGAWHRNFKSNGRREFFAGGVSLEPFGFRIGDDPVDSQSFAVFGDVTWSATEQFDISFGGRYYYDERNSGSSTPVAADLRDTFRQFSPRVSIKYEWAPDASTYVTVSKGFRSGGFNGASGTSFGPEKLWNYEIGTKASLLDGALFIDVAAYYADYKDRQAQGAIENPPGSGIFFAETRNVGKASGFGIEGAVNAKLGAGLQLDATAAWNNLKSDVTNVEVIKGERFDLVPAFTGSVALSQRVPLNDMLTGLWRVDYMHSDAYSAIARTGLSDGSVFELQNFRSRPQDYVNARIGIETQQWSVSLDVKNLLNEDTVLFPNFAIGSVVEGVRATPRSYGITFRWNYGS